MTKNNAAIQRDKHQALVERLETGRFFGVLETHFEGGRIVRIRKHETLLEEDIDRLTRS